MKNIMKPFIQTTFILFFIGAIGILVMLCYKIEKHKTQIEAHKQTIEELTDELHTYEVMYLKCSGDIEGDNYEVQYLEGKLKFCKTK
jgi:hypothetical protein